MNTDPAGTRSPHLDLADLVAEVTGHATGAQAREHLGSCEHCRAEAARWNLVADGVRGLAAAAPEEAPPAWRRPTGLRALANPRRHPVLVGSAAAALVLLAGAGYGITAALTGPAGADAAPTALTAVSGCASLEQASGTLERVNGSSLVIKAASGQPVTVTTTTATKVSESAAAGALLGDITDGAVGTVLGFSHDGTIAASFVIIADPAQQHPQLPAGLVFVQGTVADASTAGFTVVTSDGARIPVKTSSATIVSATDVSLSQLPVGATIVAVGHGGPGGTLSAAGVAAIFDLPQNTHGQAQTPGNSPSPVPARNCSPASIANALAFGS
jgi:hypothetical protein